MILPLLELGVDIIDCMEFVLSSPVFFFYFAFVKVSVNF